MGSLSVSKLPVVNFCKENLNPGTSAWLSACSNIRQALEQYGCFVAEYDKVPLQLHNAVFSAAEELFDLPKEIKRKNTSEKPYFAYVGDQPFVPSLYEGSPEWGSMKSQVRKAFKEFGCFEALFDKVPVELWKSIFGAPEALFDLPLQTKL
ncbi:hypothetical protein Pint_29955 [Pistacia integerrima]|uniref:Uncharacterized protein n=1 Tax=Pistacia integerrima TaxID=434235 RepID=A0ACC0X2S6_9ROSI|nr:hypothetical protein Pint_29955 [Pistacia integerrima]